MATTTLEELAKRIAEQNATALLEKSTKELSIQLKELDKDSNDNSRELLAEFKEAVKALKNPESTPEQKEETTKIIETIKSSAETEEQRREAIAFNKKNYNILAKISEGIKGVAANLVGTVKKNAFSILGLLTGLALLLMSPEQLEELITKMGETFTKIKDYLMSIDWEKLWEDLKGAFNTIVNYLGDAYRSINAIIEGDWETAKEEMEGHLGGLAGLLAGAALSLGFMISPTGTARLIWGGISLLGTAIWALGGWITGLGISMAGIVSAIETIGIYAMYAAGALGIGGLGAAASFAVVAGAVVAAIYAIYESIQKGIELFDSGAGWGEILLGTLIELITAPTRWLKNIISWIAEKLGFEEFSKTLDDFDITEKILDMLWYVQDWINEKFGRLISWLGIDIGPVASIEERQAARVLEREERQVARVLERQPIQFQPESAPRFDSNGLRIVQPGESMPISLPNNIGSGVMEGTNSMLNANSGPAIIAVTNGGSSNAATNVNNMSASSYNFSQGFSADDFVRSDFVNFIR